MVLTYLHFRILKFPLKELLPPKETIAKPAAQVWRQRGIRRLGLWRVYTDHLWYVTYVGLFISGFKKNVTTFNWSRCKKSTPEFV
jgi:hypothetical protein